MDVMDAGVYVSKWQAKAPKSLKVTLWGPLQAKEMGLDGWETQDGGETGFVLHNPGVKLTMGRATSTLIFVRRLQMAFLTVYFGGYPADAPAGQRKLDMQKVVAASEIFLTRLAKTPVKFEFQGELCLVDNTNDAQTVKPGTTGRLSKSGDIIDADDEIARAAGYLPAKPLANSKAPSAATKGKPKREGEDKDDEDDDVEGEAEHVEGAPSWVRVPKSSKGKPRKGEVIEADAVARKVGGKGKSEVWEV